MNTPQKKSESNWLFDLLRRIGIRSHERDTEKHHPSSPPHPVQQKDLQTGSPVQLTADGSGRLFHRRYWIDIENAHVTPEFLMSEIKININNFVPQDLAKFVKTCGAPEHLNEGDEFDVRITGPWNGPVKVVHCDPLTLVFVTIEGHMEAGEIQFHFTSVDGAMRFEIASWARSRDVLVDLVYDKLGMAKNAQKQMWTFFCDKVLEKSGGVRRGEIQVKTERTPYHGEIIEVRSWPR